MSASTAVVKMSRLKICCRFLLKPRITVHQLSRAYSVHAGSCTADPGALFIRSDVQNILKRVTNFELDKIFSTQFTDLKPPQYKLLTDPELEEVKAEAVKRGHEKLQMPPVLRPRDSQDQVLSKDSGIEGHDTHNIIFTDITYGIPDKERAIVVREPSGRLRMADHSERDRLLQVYFPREGRKYQIPQMFTDHHLERLLQEGRYVYILDRACVQFEPDDPLYIKVTEKVYDSVADKHHYDVLRSTRHFGPMTFYLTYHNRPEGLITDMIERDLISDAASVVLLHNIMHPGTVSANLTKSSPDTADTLHYLPDTQLIQTYADNDTPHGGPIQLALQAYRDAQENTSTQAQ